MQKPVFSRRCFIALTATSLLAAGLTGCSKTTSPVTATEPVIDANGSISFTDDDGNQISMKKPASAIISLYSAHTENLFALGAGEAVIGGYKTCTYPASAAFLPMYAYSEDPEAIIAASPDLVLIRPFIYRKAPEVIDQIKAAGITVVSLYPETFDDFPRYIRTLGALTETTDTASELLTSFDNSLRDLEKTAQRATSPQSLFFESTEVDIRTVAVDSMVDRAITYANGINVAAGAAPITEGSSIAPFGVEKVLERANDIDVYVSQRGAMNSGGSLQAISERPGYDTIKAVQDDRVYTINEKLISSPTFRYVVGATELARFLYPALMDDITTFESDETATKRDCANIIIREAHTPIYTESSSRYYGKEYETHVYGMFQDIPFTDPDFDYIETAVYSGYLSWEKKDNGGEWFYPDALLTRDELAKSVFVLGDFKSTDETTSIADLSLCENGLIVQKLVDNGVFTLDSQGNFNPQAQVSCNDVIKAISFAV